MARHVVPPMDPDVLQGVIAVLGLMVPLLGLSVAGVFVLGRSRLGEALARRIAGDDHDPEIEERLLGLQDDLAQLRGQVQETQERLDFAERLLARPASSPESPA